MSDKGHTENTERVLLEGANWKELRFYQKSEALYQMTFVFCERFLPKYGDRTVDQMVQAARSGKQNIIEGSEDGKTSTEMELKLLNVARSSIHELREDFKDYLLSRRLPLWDKQHPRYAKMRKNCKFIWRYPIFPDKAIAPRDPALELGFFRETLRDPSHAFGMTLISKH